MTNVLFGKRISIKFKKEDAWIGVYWDKDDIWICLIPCFPINISKRWKPNTCSDCGLWHPNEPCHKHCRTENESCNIKSHECFECDACKYWECECN